MADRTEQQERRRRRAEANLQDRSDEVSDEIDELEEDDDSGSVSLTQAKGRATPGRRIAEDEDEGGNFFTRTIRRLVGYFEGVRSELRKVSWPTQEETRRLTIIVIITLIIASLVLGTISLLFTELFRFGLNNPFILIGFMVIAIGAGLVITRLSRRSSV